MNTFQTFQSHRNISKCGCQTLITVVRQNPFSGRAGTTCTVRKAVICVRSHALIQQRALIHRGNWAHICVTGSSTVPGRQSSQIKTIQCTISHGLRTWHHLTKKCWERLTMHANRGLTANCYFMLGYCRPQKTCGGYVAWVRYMCIQSWHVKVHSRELI